MADAPGPDHLLARLDEIGESLRRSGNALALIGLGSVGLERNRLDRYSDLDFFAIVEPGHKARYIDRLDWLEAAHPLVWQHRNTVDGHKALMRDGVFCEFAVFEPQELDAIPFTTGRVVWRRPDVADSIAIPHRPTPSTRLPDETWIVGEALSCLYVGLQRWHRGERLSAARLVQGHALDRLIELDALRAAEATASAGVDPFSRERRLEQRRPDLAAELPSLVPGYTLTPRAALAMLDALERRGAALNPSMKDRICALADPSRSVESHRSFGTDLVLRHRARARRDVGADPIGLLEYVQRLVPDEPPAYHRGQKCVAGTHGIRRCDRHGGCFEPSLPKRHNIDYRQARRRRRPPRRGEERGCTSLADRDPFAGTPWHKHVAARMRATRTPRRKSPPENEDSNAQREALATDLREFTRVEPDAAALRTLVDFDRD